MFPCIDFSLQHRDNSYAVSILLAGREVLIRSIFPEPELPKRKDSVVSIQPDYIRKLGPEYSPDGREMRCGEEIPPYSTVTTRGIEIFAQSFYRSHEDGQSMFT